MSGWAGCSFLDNLRFHSAMKHHAKTKGLLPTCAPCPDVSIVSVWANLLLHGRARPSREAFSARTLPCELRKEKYISGPGSGRFAGKAPPPLLRSTEASTQTTPLLSCGLSHAAQTLQRAQALQSRVSSIVSKTKESPTISCFLISGLSPVLSSFGT